MKNKNKHTIWFRNVSMALLGIFILNLSTVVEMNVAYADTENSEEIEYDEPVVIDSTESNSGTNSGSDSNSGSYPFNKTFTISAYYSPLPCQEKYVTGSYKTDIRLNGGGVHGADGTSVYPGMVAAPKSYSFGTKMNIPGIGTVAVHDRGGAIVHATEKGNTYDRLDIWMGYGDKGLKRALNWGKRDVNVTVYGINNSVYEDVYLGDYDSSESIPNVCANPDDNMAEEYSVADNGSEEAIDELEELAKKYNIGITPPIKDSLEIGDSGDKVSKLQEELKNLNFYRGKITGKYDEITEHAVFKFQQSQGIVFDKKDQGAGVFGPKTMASVNEIISSRNRNRILIAQATNDFSNDKVNNIAKEESAKLIAAELDPGETGDDVAVLQKFLKERGYLTTDSYTEYFGSATKEALIQFQLDNKIISNRKDTGAGRVGPGTLKTINSMS